MSDSRLEKFIYAICSMDVSDLPVPLSQIEKLWNCLITGETPDFEPLSRNEKYLMAMLDRYDISNLPAPMSRGEKLLYKIAVGETDLSDVPGYLSRYEELLKYLIENGGISGGDFEYVLYTINQSLYTLYTTAEKPVKSAILKGCTLYKIGDLVQNQFVSFYNLSIGKYLSISDGTLINGTSNHLYNKEYYLIPSGTQSITLKGENNYKKICFYDNNKNFISGYQRQVVEFVDLKKDVPSNAQYFRFNTSKTENVDMGLYPNEYLDVYLDDNLYLTNKDFTQELVSCKMPVLFTHSNGNLLHVETLIEGGYWSANDTVTSHSNSLYSKEYLFVKYYEKIKINKGNVQVLEYDENKNFIKRVQVSATGVYTINKGVCFIRISIFNLGLAKTVMVSVGDSIVPFTDVVIKTNILSTPEDLELRGIGDVKDTLNLLTGELIQNVNEIVLTGNANEKWTKHEGLTNNEVSTFVWEVKELKATGNVLCDKLSKKKKWSNTEIGIWFDSNLIITISSSIATTVEQFRTYLNETPFTVYYQSSEKSIKTVDLTVVNQDNQPTQLGTFENVTHVSLESAGLIPEVEMEVATHISEELASASPLMDDISTKQEQLNTMVDEQSENVDATMIATTEIYEETL